MSGESRKKRISSAPHLPDELLFFQILPRLAAEPLLRFSCVSKLWCTTIADPKFAETHFLRSKEKSLLLALFNDRNNKYKHLIFNFGGIINMNSEGDGEESGLVSMNAEKLTKTSIACDYENYYYVGSCNGLICFHSSVGLKICNPTIREVLSIPLPTVDKCVHEHPNFGFVFDPLKNEYKIVCIYISNEWAMVYTLGTNSWRCLTIPTRMPKNFLLIDDLPLCLDGALHWYTVKDDKCELFLFDMHDEKFLMIPAPINLIKRIFQVKGCMCVHIVEDKVVTLYIWKKHHDNNYWAKENIGLPPGDGIPFIPDEWKSLTYYRNRVVSFLDKVFLIRVDKRILTMYNLHTGVKKEVRLLPNFVFPGYEILNHVENLVSLRTFVPPDDSEVVYQSYESSREARMCGVIRSQSASRRFHFM